MNLRLTPPKAQQEPIIIPNHIILASQSIGRRTLLEKLGIRFRVAVTRIDEDTITATDPYITLKKRATAKLEDVIKNPKVYLLDEKANNIIIAADSMAVLGKKAFGKAQDREDAKAIIRALMGKTHIFATSVTVAFMAPGFVIKKRWERTDKTKVTLRKMTNPEIDLYASRYDFSRFAAGYALNETPWDFVTKIDGSYTNVIGLPFEFLLPILKTQGIITLPTTL